MKRIIKILRVFSLLLAATVVILHLIIPHDHHLSFQDYGMKDSCPLSQEKTHRHPIFPVHCHAFNDMADEKFSPPVIKQYFQDGFDIILWSPDFLLPGLFSANASLQVSSKPYTDIHVSEFFSLRAPPPCFS